jgi:DNA repair protein RecN (Recombination protein N)
LFSVLSGAYNGLYESDEMSQAVFDKLGAVLTELHGIVSIDEKLHGIYKSIEDSYYLLEGAISDIREYKDKIDFNPGLIDEVESRLDVISKLKRKYGHSIEEILSYREKIFNEREDIINSEERISSLKKELDEAENLLHSKSKVLSDMRKITANKLQSQIVDELKFLGMEKARFTVSVEDSEVNGQVNYSDNGMDKVIFLISTNPGEPQKPLSRIASGGEISRIMLAIKTVLANLDRIPSLIFDEIDTGISGKAAQAVAEKLGQISKSHQVICVTHLPQIASMADAHFYISKTVAADKTNTYVQELDEENKIREVARMLGGARLTDLTLKHAEEMINMARSIKQ